MPVPPRPPANPDVVEASVRVDRPAAEVYAFYRDFRNLPDFLGDVMAVALLGATLSRWTIQGPFGIRAPWLVKLIEARADALIRYETVGLPGFRTRWEVRFSPASDPDGTEIHEVMKLPLGTLGGAAMALIGKSPAEEVAANLRRLKQLMETGKVTDTSYAVAGKFPHG